MRLVAFLGVAAVALTAGTAGSGAGVSGTVLFGTRGTIKMIAADGTRVALATDGIKKSCDKIVVWNAATKKFTTFKANTHCPGGETSGGQSLKEIALAGDRVAWVERAAGNLEDLTLRTAGLGGPKISDAEFAENQNGAEGGSDGEYVGNVFGDGTLIAYDTWQSCTVLPQGAINDTAKLCTGPKPEVTKETHLVANQKLWKLVLGKKSAVKTGAQAYEVVAVDAGRVATQQADGKITLLSSSGAILKVIAVPSGTFAGTALQGTQLATLRNGTLEVYDTGSGALTKKVPLPAKARLRDLQGGLAVYLIGTSVYVVRISDAKTVTIAAPGSGPIDAQLEAAGLFYSYGTPQSTAKGRVAFLPLAELQQKF